jgi:putative OPT family oligopeptide transporter
MSAPAPQLTVRAVVLAVILAALMAAANTYLGLFAGMTIASAIPSAVISMAVLKLLGHGGVLENNIVQTGGSAGSSVATGAIFTMPALVMLGAWNHYPYWWVFAFAAFGGVLGVLFSVPLRRALIVEQKLTFPEGVAAAEVLRAGDNPGRSARLLTLAALAGAAVKLTAANGLRLIPDAAAVAGRFRGAIAYFGTDLSPALLGVGYVCGWNVGVDMLLGGIISWNIAIPLYSHFALAGNAALAQAVAGAAAADAAGTIWSREVRYLGVGAMLVGGVWTLIALRGSLLSGIRSGFAATRGRAAGETVPHTERDLPMALVLGGIALFSLPMLLLYYHVVGSFAIAVPMTLAMIVLAFLFCSVSGYMAGLVGSSNDPVSGMVISTVLASSALLLLLTGGSATLGPVAAVMIGAAVCCALCISGDNVQDLKAGQLVGATPWRQQVMIAIGAMTSALVLAPVLNLLARAYGIGVPDAAHPAPLLAPQATMIASVSKAMFGGQLPWTMIIVGAVLGAIVIAIDAALKARGSAFRMPVLAVAVGTYLPLDLSVPIFIGGMLSLWAARRRAAAAAARAANAAGAGAASTRIADAHGQGEGLASRGMLFAAGMIAGESLTGVILAVPIVVSGHADVLALPASLQFGGWLGLLLLATLAALLFSTASRDT